VVAAFVAIKMVDFNAKKTILQKATKAISTRRMEIDNRKYTKITRRRLVVWKWDDTRDPMMKSSMDS
jgi:hypothetical protein